MRHKEISSIWTSRENYGHAFHTSTVLREFVCVFCSLGGESFCYAFIWLLTDSYYASIRSKYDLHVGSRDGQRHSLHDLNKTSMHLPLRCLVKTKKEPGKPQEATGHFQTGTAFLPGRLCLHPQDGVIRRAEMRDFFRGFNKWFRPQGERRRAPAER